MSSTTPSDVRPRIAVAYPDGSRGAGWACSAEYARDAFRRLVCKWVADALLDEIRGAIAIAQLNGDANSVAVTNGDRTYEVDLSP